MDKKLPSYNETHSKLVEAMQQASVNDASGNYKSPKVDLGFLNQPIPETEQKRKVSFSKFGRVAAVLIIVLLSLNLFVLSTNSIDSYGEKGLLHRIHVGINGLFTDQEEERLGTDVIESFAISDFSKMDLAKEFLPELYVPGYIPDGYAFESLDIKEYSLGDYEAKYDYANESKHIYIICYYSQDSRYAMYAHDDVKVYELQDRIINIYEDKSNAGYIADVYTEASWICIKGVQEKELLLRIAEELQNS